MLPLILLENTENRLPTNTGNNKSQFMKIHIRHHAIVSNHLITLKSSLKHVTIQISAAKRTSSESGCSGIHIMQNRLHSHWQNCF